MDHILISEYHHSTIPRLLSLRYMLQFFVDTLLSILSTLSPLPRAIYSLSISLFSYLPHYIVNSSQRVDTYLPVPSVSPSPRPSRRPFADRRTHSVVAHFQFHFSIRPYPLTFVLASFMYHTCRGIEDLGVAFGLLRLRNPEREFPKHHPHFVLCLLPTPAWRPLVTQNIQIRVEYAQIPKSEDLDHPSSQAWSKKTSLGGPSRRVLPATHRCIYS